MWELNLFSIDPQQVLIKHLTNILTSQTVKKPNRPCILCSDRGFSLNYKCGVVKLNSAEILQMIFFHKLCPNTSFQCKLKYHNGTSKVCTKGCKLKRIPIHQAACKHSNEVQTI